MCAKFPDLVLIETSMFSYVTDAVLMVIDRTLHKKSEVSIKTRSIPTSLSFKGQATKHTTAKWFFSNKLSLTYFLDKKQFCDKKSLLYLHILWVHYILNTQWRQQLRMCSQSTWYNWKKKYKSEMACSTVTPIHSLLLNPTCSMKNYFFLPKHVSLSLT